jgi:hypothetical protein
MSENIIFLYVFFTGCVFTSWMWDSIDNIWFKVLNIVFGFLCGWLATPILIGRAIKQIKELKKLKK